jgi:hypothetical protein
MARLSDEVEYGAQPSPGHIIKARYTPVQTAVLTLEEQAEYQGVWEKRLDGFPVIVAGLHSQIGPASAALNLRGKRVAYIMTDGAALPLALSRLVKQLRDAGFLAASITAGQAFGGEFETVTVYSALLAARHIIGADAAIVCQGPGNAGTDTRYGFSGIEQAALLDAVSALGGMPIAAVRASEADMRPRHQGISHHTTTCLQLTHATCVVGLPARLGRAGIAERHVVRYAEDAHRPIEALRAKGIEVTSMGRNYEQDPLFFEAAGAAGLSVE